MEGAIGEMVAVDDKDLHLLRLQRERRHVKVAHLLSAQPAR
jgi:hypothetical protein